jgi:hypothetical protein
MDIDDARLVTFVKQRIADDVAVARRAHPSYAEEATSRVTSPDHAAFVGRFGPDWVAAESARKAALVEREVKQSERHAKVSTEPYRFDVVRLLASAWRDHPDFQPHWLGA